MKVVKKISKRPYVLAPPKSDDEGEVGDDDFKTEKSHKQFLEGIVGLNKRNHIKKPTSTEISDATGDHFHLTKNLVYGDESHNLTKGISDLLKTKNTHIKAAKAIKKNKKVLKKKIEQSVSDKLQREVAYEKSKKELGKWDAIVASNQSSEHQVRFETYC